MNPALVATARILAVLTPVLVGPVFLGPVPSLAEPLFVDVTAKSGIDHVHETGAYGQKLLPETMGSGVVVFDADGDLDLDLLFVNGARFAGQDGPPARQALYLNAGDWRFESGRDLGLDVEAYCLGGAAADLDNDGDSDVFLACLGRDLLFENRDGRFVEIGELAGLSQDDAFGAGAALVDIDRDGQLDIFVTRYVEWTPETDRFCTRNGRDKSYCTPESYSGASPRVYRNLGDLTFADQTRRAGLYQPGAKALGVSVLDIEGDGWPDLAVACDTSRNLLFQNQGNGTFSEIGLLAGMALSTTGKAQGGMGIDAADFERSGRPSLLISYFSNEMVGLYSNLGDAIFSDVSPSVGLGRATRQTLGWGTFFFDFDLDGDLDVLVVNGHLEAEVEAGAGKERYAQPAQLFRNQGGRFLEVTGESLGDLATPRVSRGAAYGDLDGDGDLDVVVTENGGPARLYENRTASKGHWVRLRLQGIESQRQGLGARLEVHAGDQVQTWLMRTGGSYLSQSQIEPTFGLGAHDTIDQVVVHWPSGIPQTLTDLPVDRVIEIRESRDATSSPGVPTGEGHHAETAVSGEPASGQGPSGSETSGDGANVERAAEHHNRGLLHLAENRFDEAVTAFEAALAIHPPASAGSENLETARGVLLYNTALAFLQARRFEEALPKAQALAPTSRALVLKARILRSLGRRAEAFDAWQTAREAEGLDVASLWHLAQLLQLAERPADAAGVLEDLSEKVDGTAARAAIHVERAEAGAAALDRSDFDEKAWDDTFTVLSRAVSVLAPDDGEVEVFMTEAQAAREAKDGPETSVLISITGNLLRATAPYQEAAASFLKRGPDSPLSDDPLAWPSVLRAETGGAPRLRVVGSIPAVDGRALCDADGDLLMVGERVRRWRRPDDGEWIAVQSWPQSAKECGVVDLDEDGTEEVVLLDDAGALVLWPDEEPSRLAAESPSGLTVFDHDLDGDADLVLIEPTGLRLWRNNRDRTFTAVDRSSSLSSTEGADILGAIASDLVGDPAAELYVSRVGSPNRLLGGWQDEQIAPRTFAPAAEISGPVAIADLDHDRDLDVIGAGRWFRRTASGWQAEDLDATAGAARLGTVDLDADGFSDLLVLGPSGLQVLRGLGDGEFVPWGDLFSKVHDVAAADYDRDGRLELAVLREGRIDFVAVERAGTSVVVAMTGTKDNTNALGSRLDLVAGALQIHGEVRHSTFELGETGSERLLGLGDRELAQWLRVVWPNRTWAAIEDLGGGRQTVEQSPDLVGSCPFLYVWDGERFAFVTDLLGGAPLGLPATRTVDMPIDPDEAVLLPTGLLTEKDGVYEMRIAVELREMLFLDHVALIAVDRPDEVAIATDDGLRGPPFPPFRIYASEAPRPPRAAIDHRGVDVLDRVLEIDGYYPDGFAWSPYQGYAEPHALILDFALDTPLERPFLVVHGGYYWSEADSLALSQSTRWHADLPSLEVWDGRSWRTLLDPMPFPGGRAKTIAINLEEPLGELREEMSDDLETLTLRLRTNLRLYYDQILLGNHLTPTEAVQGVRVRELSLESAELTWRGYSTLGPFDGRLPPPYDYQQRAEGRPYPRIEGFYTRFGDVLPLVETVDNASVILHHGEEVILRFPALDDPPPTGWQRDFLLLTSGWDKDGDPNVDAGSTVLPLPFRGMSRYPYEAPEHFPWTLKLRELQRTFQTRWISGPTDPR